MKSAPIPKCEDQRLASLDRYRVLDTPAEAEFDDFTLLAAHICGTPIALISLVDADRQWFKSKVGLDADETPRNISFCGHAVAEKAFLEVPDTLLDERFFDNPLVTGIPNIRFYAGAPLITPDGEAIGTLCVIDEAPRKLSDTQRAALEALGRQVVRQLNARLIERDLHQTGKALRTFFDTADDLAQSMSPDGQLLFVNPAWLGTLGYGSDEVPALNFFDLVDEGSRERCRSALAALESAPRSAQMEITFRTRGGDTVTVEGRLCAELDGDAVQSVRSIFRDIGERKKGESQLRENESRLRMFADATQEGLLFHENGVVLEVNKAFTTLSGYARDELIGMPVETVVSSHSAPVVRWHLNKDTAANYEVTAVCKDGSTRVVHVTSGPAVYEGRQIRFACLRDLTEFKRIEQEILQLNQNLESLIEERTAELRASEEHFRAVTHSAHVAIVSADKNGNIMSWNQGAQSMFGHASEEVLGKPLTILMPERYRAAHTAGMKRFLASGEKRVIGTHVELEGLRKDGSTFPLELSLAEWSTAKGQFFTGILQDISERKQSDAKLQSFAEDLELKVAERTAELERARNEAEEANKAKSIFLASMSHEIRTPMNGVLGMLEVLQQSSLLRHQLEMVDLIRDSAFSLLTIIDDILDFSKIEAGELKIENAPTSPSAVVDKVCGLLQYMADKNNVELTQFTDPSLPDNVIGDAVRLQQILLNLVNNAIKFSNGAEARGRVHIRALLAGSDAQTANLEFRVSDNGIGMDSETQARIFAPFSQADESTTRRFGGTGLGLTISRNLVEMMGGSIELQSAPDAGSTFTVRIPFVRMDQAEDPKPGASPVAGLNCVVVGDSPGQAEDFAIYLSAAGATVERASNLISARDRARILKGPLVIWVIDSELQSPSLETLRNAGLVRKDIESRFVLIERGKRRNPRIIAKDLVAVDGNALSREIFLRAVGSAAGRKRKAKATISSPAKRTRQSAITRNEAVRQNKLILVAEDNEVNQKVVLHQLRLLGLTADVARNGREAMKRLAEHDYALLLTDLHMPKMDGYELTAAVRLSEAEDRRLPIIAMTANAAKDEAARCAAAGMDAYLPKPVPLSDFQAVLRKWLPEGSINQASASKPDVPGSSARNGEVLDLRALTALVGSDAATVADFLKAFRVSAETTIRNLDDALKQDRVADVANLAHQLKSPARSVGAHALGDICNEMERAAGDERRDVLSALVPGFQKEATEVQRYIDSYLARDEQ